MSDTHPGFIYDRKIDPLPEYPDGAAIRGYGELMFLMMREAAYRDAPLWRVRAAVQPAVDLGQYQVFRIDGVARSAVTWAFLGEAEQRTLLDRDRLEPAAWHSGPNLWVKSILAPYAQRSGAMVMNWLRQAVPPGIDTVRWLRLAPGGGVARVMEAQRLPNGRWGTHTRPSSDFSTA